MSEDDPVQTALQHGQSQSPTGYNCSEALYLSLALLPVFPLFYYLFTMHLKSLYLLLLHNLFVLLNYLSTASTTQYVQDCVKSSSSL